MKKILLLSLLLGSIAGFAKEEENQVKVTVGGAYSNSVFKKDSSNTTMPYLNVSYKNFYIGSRVGYDYEPIENLKLGVYTDLFSVHRVKGKDMQEGYKSIEDRKSQISFGGKVNYRLYNVEMGAFFQGGKRGTVGGGDLKVYFPVSNNLILFTGADYEKYSKKYTDYYFGIHDNDLGGKLNKTYSPKSGSSYGFRIGSNYKLNDKFSISASVRAGKYSKEIRKSDITTDKTMYTGVVGVSYEF